ncbi:Polyamine transport [Fusarium acuminatum]|uniref:Polyamine transport n=1 Tax=Fusarium acuminatum TaxID=5515 RepID=A0ABZ2WT89_9HYPO
MFSALIGHTRALPLQGELEGLVPDDVGDFEHTPPPSNRASLDMSRDEAEKPAASKRIETSLDTISQHRLHKSSLNGSKIASKNKHVPTVSIPSSKTDSSMSLAEDLDAIPGPPYHKPSSLQNWPATDNICTKPSILSQDIHSSKGTVALAELSSSMKPMETSRDEPQVCPSTQNNSVNSDGVLVGGG